MKPAALGAVLLLIGVPAAALSAQSCPGPDLSVAPAGATSVEVRYADVPNARFPGRWQQGRLADLSYRLYPGGLGTIGGGAHMEAWRIEISCNPRDRTCTYWNFGEVPEGMQPQARKLGSCLLGPEARVTPPTPAASKTTRPAAEPKAPAREPLPAAPKAAAAPPPAARQTPPPAAEPRTLARKPAPVSADTAAAPSRAAGTIAPTPAGPRTLTREPAPASPEEGSASAPASRQTAQPTAGQRAIAREPAPSRAETAPAPAPAARESALPSAEPRAFLCWTVPAVGETDMPAPGSEVLVCRPAPVSPSVSVAPTPAAPTREAADPRPVPQTPAPVQESNPRETRPPSDSAGSQRQPEAAPLPPGDPEPGNADNRDPRPGPAPGEEGSDADRREAEAPASAPAAGDAAAPGSPRQSTPDTSPAPRPRATTSPPAAPRDARKRVNLLPLTRPGRDEDRPQASLPGPAVTARPARPATPARPAAVAYATPARMPPPPRAVQRPQPAPATTTPRLALTRCALGSALGLGQEDMAEVGQISLNIGCSGRFGDRLTFSVGLTTYPVSGDRHGGDLTYSYALNWRITDQVTLTYANYTAALAGGRALAGLSEGRLQLSTRLARLPLVSKAMPDRALTCTGFVSVARSASSNAGVNCGVNVTPRLTVRFTALAYPPGTQEEGDADYSYSASYVLNDRVTLNYSNYANNRWPWNQSPDQVELFHGGSLGLSYRWDF